MPVNPAGGDLPPNVAALIAQELASLANDAQALAARLVPGDVVDATVLPSNGLTDLLDIGGLRVAAELPPTLVPGEAIRVLVTGLDGERINLQLMSESPPASANGPSPAAANVSPAAAAAAAFGGAVQPSELAGASLPGPAAGRPGIAPPAAESRPAAVTGPLGAIAPQTPSPAKAGAPAPQPAPNSPLPARVSSVVQPPAGRSALPPLSGHFAAPPAPAVLPSIEARLAAAHAASAPASRGPVPPAPRSPVPFVPRPPELPGAARSPGPPIEPRPAGLASAAAGPGRAAGSAATAAEASSPREATVGPVTALGPRTLSALSEPAALLRALRLPVTAANSVAARSALESPEKLPGVLAALEKSTADGDGSRVATIHTLASFLARLDPRSPVFAAQIAAFVDHVATGPEAKLAQLAPSVLPPAEPVEEESGIPSAAPARLGADGAPGVSPQAPAPAMSVAPERLAGTHAALDYDLKTQLLALAADRTGGSGAVRAGGAELDRVVAGALTAITAVQLGAAAALRAHPDGFAFTLPVALPGGVGQAHVRIDRDAPGVPKMPLDGDNFHIAFVLTTKHLGTVAIELVTVGRTVSLSIKTEAARAQQRFGDALSGLRTRLEGLHYRIAAAETVVAPPAAVGSAPGRIGAGDPSARPARAADAARLVDIEA